MLRRLAGDTRPTDRVALYARVSSHGQKDNGDLDRQLGRLTDYAHDYGWSIENTYTDVGSGLNEDRRGLDSLLDDIQEADYGRVLITYEDRLTRFGFSYLERYFRLLRCHHHVIKDETDRSAQEELIDDLTKLVASSSGKLYGMRSNKKQQVVNTVGSEVKPDEYHLSLLIRLPDDDADRFDRLATLTRYVANHVLEDHWTPGHLGGVADASHQA